MIQGTAEEAGKEDKDVVRKEELEPVEVMIPGQPGTVHRDAITEYTNPYELTHKFQSYRHIGSTQCRMKKEFLIIP